jgi:hypothetical protein
VNDYGKYPPGHGYAWRGDWQQRLFDILRSHGFETLTAFAQHRPLATLADLVTEIGEGDVAQSQLQQTLVDEARARGTLRQCAQDLLVRRLRKVKAGWPSDRSWEAQEDIRGQIIAWRVALGEDYDAVSYKMIRALLDTLDLPTGWLPSGPEDPVITALFEQHWPEESSETKPPGSVVQENE